MSLAQNEDLRKQLHGVCVLCVLCVLCVRVRKRSTGQ